MKTTMETYTRTIMRSIMELAFYKNTVEDQARYLVLYLLSEARLKEVGDDLFLPRLLEQVITMFKKASPVIINVDFDIYPQDKISTAMEFWAVENLDELAELVHEHTAEPVEEELGAFADEMIACMNFVLKDKPDSNKDIMKSVIEYVKEYPKTKKETK